MSQPIMSETIIMITNKLFTGKKLAMVRKVADENGATFVRCNDGRVSNHKGWFTYRNIGIPFTTRVAQDIRAQLSALGIEL